MNVYHKYHKDIPSASVLPLGSPYVYGKRKGMELEWVTSLKGREKEHLMQFVNVCPKSYGMGGMLCPPSPPCSVTSLLDMNFMWRYASHVLSESTTSLFSFSDYFLVFLAAFPPFELPLGSSGETPNSLAIRCHVSFR